jgi:hypothetical protein
MVDGGDHVFERLLLAAKLLSPLRVVPDRRVFERGVDFF